MNPIERLKRKIVSRLLGEVDIIYFEGVFDNKIAKLTYNNREIIVEERNKSYLMFFRHSGKYAYLQEYSAGHSREQAIQQAKNFIKDEERWKQM